MGTNKGRGHAKMRWWGERNPNEKPAKSGASLPTTNTEKTITSNIYCIVKHCWHGILGVEVWRKGS